MSAVHPVLCLVGLPPPHLLFLPPPQIQVTNPSTACGKATTTLTADTAPNPLPPGWVLRTCVPIVVDVVTGASCSTYDAGLTSWTLVSLKTRATIARQSGPGNGEWEHATPPAYVCTLVARTQGGRVGK